MELEITQAGPLATGSDNFTVPEGHKLTILIHSRDDDPYSMPNIDEVVLHFTADVDYFGSMSLRLSGG